MVRQQSTCAAENKRLALASGQKGIKSIEKNKEKRREYSTAVRRGSGNWADSASRITNIPKQHLEFDANTSCCRRTLARFLRLRFGSCPAYHLNFGHSPFPWEGTCAGGDTPVSRHAGLAYHGYIKRDVGKRKQRSKRWMVKSKGS